jgi:CRISPR-associated protein Cmr3
MSIWIIEPREPLIVRDGRPFNRQPGVMANTLPFPFPSTTAGAARSRAGSEDGLFTAYSDLTTLLTIPVRGPLLVEFIDDDHWRLLVPAPGDALLLEDDKLLRCQRLQPVVPPADARTAPFRRNGEKNNADQLLPIGPATYNPAKPAKRQPAFWRWNKFEEWLLKPEQKLAGGLFAREELGIQSLPQEERIHVALERDMMVAREGGLFETRGLEFTNQPGEEINQARRLALWLAVAPHETYNIQEGLDNLGGERRLVSWKLGNQELPQCSAELRKQILQDRACRLILLTPAYFRQGYLPDIEHLTYRSAKPLLRAALVQRPQVVSGWDINSHKEKPTRRLAPAGSVFFLEFPDQASLEDIEQWINQFWMNTIGDNAQDCLDGFGLAVPGTWDGEPKPMYDPRNAQQKEQQ